MKQTAVEWLENQIKTSKYFYNLMEEIQSRSTIAEPNGILHQAKAMEKEQLENAWYAGDEDGAMHEFEYYYNETYKKD